MSWRPRFSARGIGSAAACLALALGGCGGGGGGSSTPTPAPPAVAGNQLLITVQSNPDVTSLYPKLATVNIPYVTVTVCDSTGQCQTVDHVVVDTGSYGLRVLQSAVPGLNLPPDPAAGGAQLGECAKFLSGYIWGSVAHATLVLGAQTTSSLPIQVIGASGFPSAPSGCSSQGNDVGTLQGLQGNGLLGVGHFVADGGDYYACTSSGCNTVQPAASAMVSNPVAYLNSGDNNGVVLQMPAVPTSGAGTTYGTLSFGVGTQPDNAVTGFSVIPADFQGNLTVNLRGTDYAGSFIDSGSNFYFAPLSGVVPTDNNGYFIPSSLLNLPITLKASASTASGASLNSQMYIGDYSSMDFVHYVAFNDIGIADGTPTTSGAVVDLGMPYFYGRSVAYVIYGMSSPIGTGPLYAIR
ncbi:MAG: DUF3443 family protein [Betaproteobacteria bacterium]|nr:DUF3443 family protein [Betaproteobacteria bacterium]